MDTQDLKKYLAGFGIAGLIAGAALAIGPTTGKAESSCTGNKGGTGVTTKDTSTQSSCSGSKAAPTAAPAPTGSCTGSKAKPATPTPSGSCSGSK